MLRPVVAAKVETMAAKNKPTRRTRTSDTDGTAVEHSSVGLHFRAAHLREELLEEARSLMAEGRVREAHAVEKRVGQVEQLLGALESELSPAESSRKPA